MIVVDASIVGTFLLPDEQESLSPAAANAIFAAPLIVPMHWHLEVASIVQNAIRRRRVDADTGADLLRNDMLKPEIDRETIARAWGTTLPLAQRLRLTVYDAAYLELAIRRNAPLTTLDKALAAAASAEGIEVITLP